MALKRWTPRSMEKFFHDMFEEPMPERFLRSFPAFKWMREYEEVSPDVDMYEEKDEIIVKAEVPGIDKENIKISISDGVLSIKGEIKKEEEIKEGDYYYSERSYGSFMRALNLPAKVVENKVKAEVKDGILEIHMPKAAEER